MERRSRPLGTGTALAGALSEIPEIDVEPLLAGGPGAAGVSAAIDEACRDVGLFYLTGHGVDPSLQARLDALAREFFALPHGGKERIAMARGGRAWRGWFPLGGELTAGVADMKEGLYFGTELADDHPRVQAGTPLHGRNLFPAEPGDLGPVVLAWMEEMSHLSAVVLRGMALALGLEADWFPRHLTADPLRLFRIFRYPPDAGDGGWGVGEHTDYGLLTILAHDGSGGLEVRTHAGWVQAAPPAGAFVCNLGDMLERLTGGRYRSTPHRVRHAGAGDRLSFPFFFDPSWDAVVDRLPIVERPADDGAADRWDHASVHGFSGTYGDYVLAKVAKVFPDLAAGAGAA
jgi:isopenicillin N synthase-like dioxygenase